VFSDAIPDGLDLDEIQVVSAPFRDHCMELQHWIYMAYNQNSDVRDLDQKKGW